MKQKNLTIISICALCLLSFSAHSDSEKRDKLLGESLEQAKKVRKLPNSNNIVAFSGLGEVVVVDGNNPRWVVKGELYDMWANKRVNSNEELERQSSLIPLSKMAIDTNKILDVTVNKEKKQVITIFVQPFESKSIEAINLLLKYASRYQLRFIITPTDQDSMIELAKSGCWIMDSDGRDVLDSMVIGEMPVSSSSCSLDRLTKSFALSQFLMIQRYPVVIAPNGSYSTGVPENLMSWLEQNEVK